MKPLLLRPFQRITSALMNRKSPHSLLMTSRLLCCIVGVLALNLFVNLLEAQAQMRTTRVLRGQVITKQASGQPIGLANVTVKARVANASLDGLRDSTFQTQTNPTGAYTLVISAPAVSSSVVFAGSLQAIQTGRTFAPDSVSLAELVASVGNANEIDVEPFEARTFQVSGVVVLNLPSPLTQVRVLTGGEFINLRLQLVNAASVEVSSATVSFASMDNAARQLSYSFTNVAPGTYTLRIVLTNSGVSSAMNFSLPTQSVTVGNESLTLTTITATPVYPTISGVVRFNNQPRANVLVRVSNSFNSEVLTARTGADGRYSFVLATRNTYRVEAVADGFTSAPNNVDLPDITFNWLTGSRSNLDFTLTTQAFSIIGLLRYDPSRFPEMPVRSWPDVVAEAISLSAGIPLPRRDTVRAQSSTENFTAEYRLSGLPLGQYRITPISTSLSFEPPALTVSGTANGAVVRVRDTIVTRPIVRTIRGFVTLDSAGSSSRVRGETVTLVSIAYQNIPSNRITTTATTDGLGEYIFRVPDGAYELYLSETPARAVVAPGRFTPIVLAGRDTTIAQDFLMVPKPPRRFIVSGDVVLNTTPRVPVSDVQLSLVLQTNLRQDTIAIASPNGDFRFTNVTSATYIITPSIAGYVFTPSARTVAVRERNVDAGTFQATLAPTVISGAIASPQGVPQPTIAVRVGIDIDEITLAPKRDTLVLSNDRGIFSANVSGLLPNQRILLTPVSQTLIFGPQQRIVVASPSVNNGIIQSNITITNQDFRALSTTAGIQLGVIEGVVVPPIAGVLVTDGVRRAVSDAEGKYTIRNVPNGNYLLRALKPLFRFRNNPIGPIEVRDLRVARGSTQFQTFASGTTNHPPVLERIPGNPPGRLEVSLGRPQFFRITATDPDGDALSYTAFVDDPTIARARVGRDSVVIDPLSDGNTAVTLLVTDNQGGVAMTTFRVVVRPASDVPTTLVRASSVNTNHNAALIITRGAIRSALAQAFNTPKDDVRGQIAAAGDELAAFNSRDEVVGSIILSGEEDVLPVWSIEPESKAVGMLPGDRLRYELVVINGGRRSKSRVIAMYILGEPPPWPIDGATLVTFVGVQTPPELTFKAYPNPASDAVSVEYSLATPSVVKCDLVNAYGQSVAVLASERQGTGKFRFVADVSDLPSGLYSCRLQLGETSFTTPILIVH